MIVATRNEMRSILSTGNVYSNSETLKQDDTVCPLCELRMVATQLMLMSDVKSNNNNNTS